MHYLAARGAGCSEKASRIGRLTGSEGEDRHRLSSLCRVKAQQKGEEGHTSHVSLAQPLPGLDEVVQKRSGGKHVPCFPQAHNKPDARSELARANSEIRLEADNKCCEQGVGGIAAESHAK